MTKIDITELKLKGDTTHIYIISDFGDWIFKSDGGKELMKVHDRDGESFLDSDVLDSKTLRIRNN